MTQQQWENHKDHMDNHISWPATKEEIIAACGGSDVEASVLEDMKNRLMDGERRYSEEELRQLVVDA